MPRWLNGLIVGAATALIGVTLELTPLGADFEKHVGLDWLFHIRGAIKPPSEVAVVAINERTAGGLDLPELPRDWPRSIHGRLIDKLVERGASVIVFDMDFQRPKEAEDDRAFANAVARAGRVVLFTRLNGKRQPIFDINGQPAGTIWTEELIPPIPELADAAKALAPFPVPKVQVNVYQFWAFKPSVGEVATMPVAALQVYAADGYDPWLAMLARLGVAGIETLPRQWDAITNAVELRNTMSTLRRAFKNDPQLGDKIRAALAAGSGPELNSAQYRWIEILTRLFEGDDNRYLNFYGPPGSIKTIPYNAVITGEDPTVDAADLDFSNQVVFVGLSDLYDPGQPDRFYTVFTRSDGVDLSGVEIAATAFGNLLTDRVLTPSSAPTSIAILIVFGVIMGTGVYLLTAVIAVPLALLLAGAYLFEAQYEFNTADLWLPVAIPILVQLPIALFIGLLGQYLFERRREKRLSQAVSYYLPAEVAKNLTEKEIDPRSLDKVVYGCCLGTDMSGFTTISENMAPSELAVFMNTYFGALGEALKQQEVDVTEFRADNIMCAWTSEQVDAIVCRHAALASLAVVDAVRRFNEQMDVTLYPRVGIAEGMIYVGHTGGGGRLGYSILGDCANTAARLENLNKKLGTHILASQAVIENIGDLELLTRPIGKFALVGKAEPTPVVEILAAKSSAPQSKIELCERFAEAMDTSNLQQWEKASELFESILQDFPQDGPSQFHLTRCRNNQAQSQPVRDAGVVVMDTK